MSRRVVELGQALRRLRRPTALACGVLVVQTVEAAPSRGPTSSREIEPVVVLAPQCKSDSLPFVAFVDALRVELAASGFRCCAALDRTDRMSKEGVLYARVDMAPCLADGDRVQVSLLSTPESAGAQPIEREVVLTDVVEKARPRALALAVAELIRSSTSSSVSEVRPPPTQPSPLPSPPPPQPPPSPPTASPEPAPWGVSLKIGGEWRWLPARDTTVWGGRTQLTVPWRSFHVDFDVGGNYAEAHRDLGTVLCSSVSAGIGVGPRFATQLAIFDLGLRAELGWAWITGAPASSDVLSAAGSDLISKVGARVSLEIPARARVRPNLGVEGGGILHGILGEVSGQPVMGIQGSYFLSVLGVAISL